MREVLKDGKSPLNETKLRYSFASAVPIRVIGQGALLWQCFLVYF